MTAHHITQNSSSRLSTSHSTSSAVTAGGGGGEECCMDLLKPSLANVARPTLHVCCIQLAFGTNAVCTLLSESDETIHPSPKHECFAMLPTDAVWCTAAAIEPVTD